MFFGPQKLITDYSRKKVIPLGPVISSGTETAVLKSCVLNRRTEVVAAELFVELLASVDDADAAFHLRL
jgi:hypothetical protein